MKALSARITAHAQQTRGVWAALPSILTGLRLLVALPLGSALYHYDLSPVVWLLSLAVITDLLDGWLARRLQVCSTFGAYFDTTADFALAMAAFGALTARNVYPLWVLAIIVLMFVQFVWTSRYGQPLYDPVGKYYGAVLYSVVFVLVMLPDLVLSYMLLAAIVIVSALSLGTRIFWLLRTPRVRIG